MEVVSGVIYGVQLTHASSMAAVMPVSILQVKQIQPIYEFKLNQILSRVFIRFFIGRAIWLRKYLFLAFAEANAKTNPDRYLLIATSGGLNQQRTGVSFFIN